MTATPVEPAKSDPGSTDLVIPPGPARESDLKWKPRPMVRWLSPGQLTATGVRALLSTVFGAYADRREVQAALHQFDQSDDADPECAPFRDRVYHYEDRSDPRHGFWLDFVADLGDGFDSTYTVAWLLSRPWLPAPAPGAPPVEVGESPGSDPEAAGAPDQRTYRGQILVMGGDQVYPTASRHEYTDRMAGPYEAAFPWTKQKPPPHLYAIPGNHDWYDGLTAFLRLFCQRRWIGGWRTQQSRSYFALQLPHRWWLLGLDAQLQSDIDQPQYEYFCDVAEQMRPGDRVILCTSTPAWVHTEADPTAFDNLAYVERTVLAPRGVELALTLTGDLHHYARYTDAIRPRASKHHKITAGGGGAYLLGTGLLARELNLAAPPEAARPGAAPKAERYLREAEYPATGESMGLKWGALRLAWKNPSFALFLGLMYALFAWFLQSSSKLFLPLRELGASREHYDDFLTFARDKGPAELGDVLEAVWLSTSHSPMVVVFSLLIISALIAFCAPDVERSRLLCASKPLRTAVRAGVGLVHGVAHLALAVGMTWLIGWVLRGVAGGNVDAAAHVLLFLAFMAIAGGTVGAVMLSLFLLPGVNYNEAFSAQHLESHRNFLRLHLARDGSLTVYPYGVNRAEHWHFRPNAPPEAPYFVPKSAPKVCLIDGPITLAAPPGETHAH